MHGNSAGVDQRMTRRRFIQRLSLGAAAATGAYLLAACQQTPASTPAAPKAETKPAAKPTEAAAKPAASPAAGASPAASPAAKPGASPSPAAASAIPSLPQSSWKPDRPVELVVQAAAGGGSDIFARQAADIMTKEKFVEQPINVVNKPGGSGAIAYAYLNEKKGNPLFIATATGSYLTTPIQGQSPVSYKDFTNLAVLCAEDYVLVVKADSPYRTMKDLIDAAKARPSGIRVGGSSVGSSDSIITYRIEQAAGVKLNYVVFQSGGEVNAALLGGSVEMATPNPSEANELIKAGRLRPLAMFSPQRLKNFPDVPTAREQGFDVTLDQFRGVIAPGGITADQSLYWQNAMVKLFSSAGFQAYLDENGLRPLLFVGKEAEDYIVQENGRMVEALRALGIAKE